MTLEPRVNRGDEFVWKIPYAQHNWISYLNEVGLLERGRCRFQSLVDHLQAEVVEGEDDFAWGKRVVRGQIAGKCLEVEDLTPGEIEGLGVVVTEGLGAEEVLVQKNLGLAGAMAKRYALDDDWEELKRVGERGLLEAAWRYDYTRGIPFGGYARWWLVNYMEDWSAERAKIYEHEQTFSACGEKDLDLDRRAWMIDEDEGTEEQALMSVELARFKAVSQGIEPRDWRILEMYYLEGMPMKQIGEVLGIGKAAVSLAKKKAIRKLRLWG